VLSPRQYRAVETQLGMEMRTVARMVAMEEASYSILLLMPDSN
jgi:hypothetical protein